MASRFLPIPLLLLLASPLPAWPCSEGTRRLADRDDIHCHRSDGDEFVTIQRRDDGREPFWNRTWSEYQNGFGDRQGAGYWIGLRYMSLLAAKPTTLRFEMWGDRAPGSTHSTEYFWADYIFSLEGEATNYVAHFKYDWQNPSGNATTGWYASNSKVRLNGLTCNDGVPFSTVDRILDPTPRCVTEYHLGGWWLRNCAFASLNGEYSPSLGLGNGYGLFWIVDGGFTINPRKTRMSLKQ